MQPALSILKYIFLEHNCDPTKIYLPSQSGLFVGFSKLAALIGKAQSQGPNYTQT